MTDSTATASRSATIAQQLREQILDGKYEAGERVPSERELASRTGANRASVREALKQLQQQGLIEIKRGGGARVVPLDRSELGLLQHLLARETPDPGLVREWLDVWRLVLSGSARLAVERADDHELARAVELIGKLRKPSLDDDDFLAIGDELTELISIASRNTVLQMVRNGLVATFDRRRDLRKRMRPRSQAFTRRLRTIEKLVLEREAAAVGESVYALIGLHADDIIELMTH